MSLSSFLLPQPKGGRGARETIDNDLDALFRSNAVASIKPATPVSVLPFSSEKKRKLNAENTNHGKRSKGDGSKRKRVGISAKIGEVVEGDEDTADLGNSLHQNSASKDTPEATKTSDSEDSDIDGEFPNIIHESLVAGKAGVQRGKRSGPQMKYVPPEETPEQRDARTIFIGNLAIEVAKKKPLLKKLQRHILAQIPSAKIESTRFRSVPFQNPTSKLPTSDNEGTNSTPKPPKSTSSAKETRPHDRDRTTSWRERQTEDADYVGNNDEKKFLNNNQKKKIAFINQEFHTTADTINAYIVFAHPPVESRPLNLPPLPPIMDPYEAAPLAAEKCDGTVFMERMIRVDTVGKAVQAGEKTQDKDGAISGDPKLCVFVGNLDFGSKEEDLRVFFEGVVSGERGPPSEEAAREDAALKKQVSWVTRVRIVRDKETQLGKGFAYVQFLDRQCVDEVLAIEETKLKFAKRKLRVQRCKTLPVGSSLSGLRRSATDAPSLLRHKTASGVTPVVPKGDPSLGEKLAHLPKSARKEYKSSDAKRVARRLAKKKARMALAKNGLKARAGDRDRVRKGVKKDLGPGVRKEVKAKGRVRSDKSLAKRNNKK